MTEEKVTDTKIPENFDIKVLPDDYNQYDLSFKMIVIGDAGVGKSCLSNKAAKNTFEDFYQATVGFEFLTFNARIDNKVVRLQIWDTCGQEIYRSLISSFYRNSSLAMMVYAIDSKESFIHIDSWLKEVKLQSSPDIKIFLIGNKADLEDKRQVPFESAKQYAAENDINFVNETSAKTGLNAQQIFLEAIKILYIEHLKYLASANKPGNPSIPMKINGNKNTKRDKGGCC